MSPFHNSPQKKMVIYHNGSLSMMRYLLLGTFLLAICIVTPCKCFALTVDDNGYAWNSANPEERIKVCKILARSIGWSYERWYTNLHQFYNTSEKDLLKWDIKGAAAFMGVLGAASEKSGANVDIPNLLK